MTGAVVKPCVAFVVVAVFVVGNVDLDVSITVDIFVDGGDDDVDVIVLTIGDVNDIGFAVVEDGTQGLES